MTDTEKGTSMLASLTAEVMGDKAKAAGPKRTLTPVEGEGRPGVLPRTPESFPNDFPQEVIEQKVGELTRIIDHLIEGRDALAGLIEMPLPAEVVDLKAEKKAREAAADANFAEKFAAQQAEAQAATFSDADIIEDGSTEADWLCPTHGKATEKTSERTGKTFIGCPDCNLFKR